MCLSVIRRWSHGHACTWIGVHSHHRGLRVGGNRHQHVQHVSQLHASATGLLRVLHRGCRLLVYRFVSTPLAIDRSLTLAKNPSTCLHARSRCNAWECRYWLHGGSKQGIQDQSALQYKVLVFCRAATIETVVSPFRSGMQLYDHLADRIHLGRSVLWPCNTYRNGNM